MTSDAAGSSTAAAMVLAELDRHQLQQLCKRHGLRAVGPNTALVARLANFYQSPEPAGAGEDARATKGCLKRAASGNDLRETKKVSFVLAQSTEKRRQSAVLSSPPVATRPRGRRNSVCMGDFKGAEKVESAPVRRSRRLSDCIRDVNATSVGGGAEEVASAPVRRSRRLSDCMRDVNAEAVGGGAPVRRSRRNSACLPHVKVAEEGGGAPVRCTRRNSVCLGDVKAVEARDGVDSNKNRKRKSLGNEEELSVSGQIGVPSRVTRRSSLVGAALLSPPVEKKQEKRKAAGCKSKFDAKVEAPTRMTRSCAKTATSPVVVENENKRRRVAKEAPVARVLRNRVVQVESHVVKQQTVNPARRSTCRSIAPAVLEEEDNNFVAQKKPAKELMQKLVAEVANEAIFPENSTSRVIESCDDEQAIIQVQQEAVHGGTQGPAEGNNASFEEVVHKIDNIVGTCPASPKELLLELQSAPSKENIRESCAKYVELTPSNNEGIRNILVNESAETVVYEKFLFQDESVSRMNSEICSSDPRELSMDLQTPSSEMVEGPLKSNHLNDTQAGERIWDRVAVRILSGEKKERECMRSSNCDIVDDNSHFTRYGICQSGAWKVIDEIDSKLSSCDTEVLRQGHGEGCHEVNEYEVTPAGLETDMSESVPLKRIESKIMMDGEGEEYSFSCNANVGDIIYTGSAFPDEQLNTKLKDPETEKRDCVINKDMGNSFDTELASKSKASNLSNDTLLDPSSSSERNAPNVSQWDAPKSP